MASKTGGEQLAIFRHGNIELDGPVSWAEGTRLVVRPAEDQSALERTPPGTAIIAGFGLPGRYVASFLDQRGIAYCVVERNPDTVKTQTDLGRRIILGDIVQEDVMKTAGVDSASVLALTIPDEQAVLLATEAARKLNPDIYIIARTNYASSGMKASQLGADDVVKAEQAVAFQFYEKIRQHLLAGSS